MEEFLGRMKSLLGGEYDEFLKYYEAEHFRLAACQRRLFVARLRMRRVTMQCQGSEVLQ